MDMVEWAFGVFTIMAIMATLIGGMLALRFVYINAAYTRAIDRYKTIMEEGMERGDVKDETKISEHILSYRETIGNYKNRRENNVHQGAIIDIVTITQILIVGSLAALGVFATNVEMLILLLFLIFSISAIHFTINLNTLKKEKL